MRVYYGWVLVAASLIVLTLVMGVTYHSFGVFVSPVSTAFGLSRADANTGLILFSVGGAICAPIIGSLMDRLPIQRVFLGCAIIIGASLATLGASRSLALSAAVLAAPLALGAQAGVIGSTTLIARWFNVHRGRAMAIALFGMSFAGIVITPAIAFGVEHYSWRTTLIVAGGAIAALLVAVSLFVRERPGEHDIESAAHPTAPTPAAHGATGARPLNALAILAMPQFWTIGLTNAATLGFTSAVMVTLVPLGESIGIGPTQAASLIAVLSAAGFAGGLVVAWISDRVDRTTLLTVMFLAIAGIGALFYVSDTFPMLVLAATLLGLAGGIVSPAFHALIADRFGAGSFGTAYGLMSVLMTAGSAIAVRLAGEVFDRSGAYSGLFATLIGVELIAAALLFGTRMIGKP